MNKNIPSNNPGTFTVCYLCDPALNTACEKTQCFLNGGPCRHTVHIKFAKQPIENALLMFPMSEEEIKDLQIGESK